MPARSQRGSEQPGELLVEVPDSLGIAPLVKTRPELSDPSLSDHRAGRHGNFIGLAGEPACLVDVLLLQLDEGQFKEHLGSAASAGDVERRQRFLQGPLGGGDLAELPVASARQGGEPGLVEAVHPGRIFLGSSLPDRRLGLAERHEARPTFVQGRQRLGF
jgi:hypothetical protein